MNKGFGLNGILITILIILAVGTAGVYVVKNTDLITKDTDNTIFVDEIQEDNNEQVITEQPKDKIIVKNEVDETADWKTYQNEKYNYALSYPPSWMAFEWPGNRKGEKPYLVSTVGDKGSVLFTTVNMVKEPWDFDYLNFPWLRVTRETGEAFILDSKIIDNFWSKLSKTNEKGEEVNVFLRKENINGTNFIIFNQYGWSVSLQAFLWVPQAIFMHDDNFFWVRPHSRITAIEFDQILSTFKFID